MSVKPFQIPDHLDPAAELRNAVEGHDRRDLDRIVRQVLTGPDGRIDVDRVARALAAVFLDEYEHSIDIDQHLDNGTPLFLSRKPG